MVVMRDQVVSALAELEVKGNEDGLIPAFGVFGQSVAHGVLEHIFGADDRSRK